MNKLTKFIFSVLIGAMLFGMTAFASEYSVTPASAVFYTNGETVVLADASADAQVILPECEAGLPIQVTGVTSNGYWQIVLGDATYYVVGAGLSQTAESVTSKPAQTQSAATSVSLSTAWEAYDYAVAQGYPVYQAVDNGDGTAIYYYLNINEVLPSDQSEFVGNNYVAARDIAFGYVWQYYNVPHSMVKETVGHYATLDSRWSIKSRTVHFNGYIN
ncbi:MAG: hypothetical protein IJO85_09515 [Lachnospiraceae bacterium]|nr:hypothetical protein [Lachnospiraceae bacterium]